MPQYVIDGTSSLSAQQTTIQALEATFLRLTDYQRDSSGNGTSNIATFEDLGFTQPPKIVILLLTPGQTVSGVQPAGKTPVFAFPSVCNVFVAGTVQTIAAFR